MSCKKSSNFLYKNLGLVEQKFKVGCTKNCLGLVEQKVLLDLVKENFRFGQQCSPSWDILVWGKKI